VATFLKSGFNLLKKALAKTHAALGGRLRALFGRPFNEELFEELEHVLYEADFGAPCASRFADHLRLFLKSHPQAEGKDLLALLRKEALHIFEKPPVATPKTPLAGEPRVLLVVGINGSGKTTTLAKLANLYQSRGEKVLVAAADTFRAAASEQLAIWATRSSTEIVAGKKGSDPSAIVFDALTAAKARGCSLVLIDTAGRLHNKTDLMHEVEKICKTSAKVVPSAPHETLLVLDATIGQNALDQARTFHKFTPLTGIVLAKLDGSAKGGIALAIYEELGIPIQWMGTGEGMEDIAPFDAETYVNGLFE